MRLRAGRRELELGGPPLLMGVVNATPDSFSDAGDHPDLLASASRLIADGAQIIDVGGESAVGGRPPVEVDEEIARVVPVIERIVAAHDVLVSVDTYKPEVAEAAVAAGAGMVNDVSGLRDERLADVCARTGAALIADAHARGAEGDAAGAGRVRRRGRRRRGVPDASAWRSRWRRAWGRSRSCSIPARTSPRRRRRRSRCCGGSTRWRRSGARCCWRSRARTSSARSPAAGRASAGAATLAAVEFGVRAGASILRVHDVAAAADFLAVRAVLKASASSLRMKD